MLNDSSYVRFVLTRDPIKSRWSESLLDAVAVAASHASFPQGGDQATASPPWRLIPRSSLLCLPSASPLCNGKAHAGCVIYKTGDRANIPVDAITPEFKRSARYFVDML